MVRQTGGQAVKRTESMVGDRQGRQAVKRTEAWLGTGSQTDRKHGWGQAG